MLLYISYWNFLKVYIARQETSSSAHSYKLLLNKTESWCNFNESISFLGGKAFSNTTEWTSIWAVASCRLERNWFKMPTRSNCIHTEISAQWGICFTGMIMVVRWLYTKVYCSMQVCTGSFWSEKYLMDDLRATGPYMLKKVAICMNISSVLFIYFAQFPYRWTRW